MTNRSILATALFFLPLLAVAQGTATSAPVGEVAFVTGSASVAVGGQASSLSKGDPVFAGQTVSVGPNSYVNLKFNDGGRVLLRPLTEFAVEAFSYAAAPVEPASGGSAAPAGGGTAAGPAATAGTAFFRLLRGGFRAISGLIGKGDPQSYRITTPAATIGIRGTDFEVQSCSDDCPQQAAAAAHITEVATTSLAGLELAQAGGGSLGGIVVLTNEGSIVLRTSRGDTVVDAGKVALALADGQTYMLDRVPDLMLRYETDSPEDCE